MKLHGLSVAIAASIAMAASGATYRISAPNGVGDVVALTNAVARIDAGELNEFGEHDGLPGAHYGLWMVNPSGEDVYMGLGRNQLEEAGSKQESDENGNLYYDVPMLEGVAYYFLEEWPPPAGHLVDPYPTDYFTIVHEDGKFRIVYETEPEFAEKCPGVYYQLSASRKE